MAMRLLTPHGHAMTIRVNGTTEEARGGMTVAEYLASRGLDATAVAVEVNRAIVKRDAFGSTTFVEGDTVEILHFVGGG
jgi:thiamine biosynthesis protein ThiS